MKTPNAAHARIDPIKITDYLLDASHPVGRSKATFFIRFGFSKSEWQLLANELMHHVVTYDVIAMEETAHGIRYAVDGTIQAPDGTSLNIRSAWSIDKGNDNPRLITAHPLPKP